MIIFLVFLRSCFRIIFYAPVKVALSLMYFAGWITQALARKTSLRKAVIKNVRTLLPQSNATQIADKLIRNTGYAIFELLCVPFFNKKHLRSIIKVEGTSHLDQGLKAGKGVILITLHAGNYEIIPAALANDGYTINTIARNTPDPIFDLLNHSRTQGGARVINVAEEDMYRETLSHLNKNEIVGILADTGALEGRHEFIDFLGKKVPVATGWLTLAQRSQAAVIPILVKKEGRKNTVTLYAPIKITRNNRSQAMQEAGKVFENFIRQNPEQWLIFLNSYETKRMVEGK